jgi:hypothetical protein
MNKPTLILALSCLAATPAFAEDKYPAPAPPKDEAALGAGIQRTMTLLATSTPQKRNRVRVLFYGQSITEQEWWKAVADDLRKRFPNADLEIENKALGGFASQILCRIAEHDLYPYYPDLLIFYVYGDHTKYEQIVRETRTRTTAEILMQNDHCTKDEDLAEEMDPSKLNPSKWNAWMNHVFLPGTAKKYGCGLVDQRAAWKRYLADNNLKASQLLKDGVHLNAHGNFLMAELVKRHLVHKPALPVDKDLVKTLEVGKDVKWTGDKLVVEFEGNRVDAIAAKGPGGKPPQVRIDGKKPSEFPELYVIGRPGVSQAGFWPALLRIGHEKPLQLEEWTLTVTETDPAATNVKFEVAGSKTGPDGGGVSTQKFVSNSGRVVIEPGDWWVKNAYQIVRKELKAGFKATWQVKPMFVDVYEPPKVDDASKETLTTLAQGLPNGKHTLELTGGPVPIQAIRICRPAMK